MNHNITMTSASVIVIDAEDVEVVLHAYLIEDLDHARLRRWAYREAESGDLESVPWSSVQAADPGGWDFAVETRALALKAAGIEVERVDS